MLVYCELNQDRSGWFIGYTYAATRKGKTVYDVEVLSNHVEVVTKRTRPFLTKHPIVSGDSTSHTRVMKVYEI